MKMHDNSMVYEAVIFGILMLSALTLGGCGQGPKGDAGAQGNVGAVGQQGSSGQDATPVTLVKLCAGVTPVYPSTFPEYAICLQGQLYGVYSANGGFLALLLPGQYSSNGINSSCNFIILPNCVIEN